MAAAAPLRRARAAATRAMVAACAVAVWCCLIALPLVHAQVAITAPFQPPPASAGRSPSDPSLSPNPQWAVLLGDLLYYFDAQRAGPLPEGFRVDWRNSSVLGDGSDVGLNLSSGFFDAGNFIKATLPLSWTLTQIALAATTFGQGFDAANQTAYLDRTLRVGFDYLVEASATNGSLVGQVGDLADYYWGGDQGIPTPRPTYSVDATNPGTDLFAAAATALAAGALLYAGTPLPATPSANGTVASLADAAYAARLLDRAQALHRLAADSRPQQVYQRANRVFAKAYPSTDWQDEVVLASALLAVATGDAGYAQLAASTYDTQHYPYDVGPLNWDSKVALTPVAMALLALARPGLASLDAGRYRADAERYLDAVTSGRLRETSVTGGGLLLFRGYTDNASLNPALNVAGLAVLYEGLATTRQKSQAYAAWAQSQLDYALGRNPLNAVYVVGVHPNSAQNPHSALASGGTSLATIDTLPPVMAHVLYGAVVGGPDADDRYYDERSDYDQTEAALDTVSPVVLLAAAKCAAAGAQAGDPFYVGLAQPRVTPSRPSGAGLSRAAKIAIAVVVVVVALALLVGIAVWQRERLHRWVRKRRFGY